MDAGAFCYGEISLDSLYRRLLLDGETVAERRVRMSFLRQTVLLFELEVDIPIKSLAYLDDTAHFDVSILVEV